MNPIKMRSAIQACVTAAILAVLYMYWLTIPALHYVSIGNWRALAIVAAAVCGATLSMLRVSTPVLSCGAMGGFLLGGTLVWKDHSDVMISVYAAFADHLAVFWREILILTLAATLASLCCNYLRKHRANVR